jgi:hypothetical protein
LEKESRAKLTFLETEKTDLQQKISEKETIITGAIIDLKKVRTECKAQN